MNRLVFHSFNRYIQGGKHQLVFTVVCLLVERDLYAFKVTQRFPFKILEGGTGICDKDKILSVLFRGLQADQVVRLRRRFILLRFGGAQVAGGNA